MLARILGNSRPSVIGAFLLASLFIYGSGGCNRAPVPPGNGTSRGSDSQEEGSALGSSAPADPVPEENQENKVSFGGGESEEQVEVSSEDCEADPPEIHRVIYADVVAIDQPYMVNRLGASQPAGMIFVLKQDLVPMDPKQPFGHTNFKLRKGKRPRPIVLRMNVGDVLQINFENWLQPILNPPTTKTQKLAPLGFFVQNTRFAGIHVNGLDLVPPPGKPGIDSDGSWVGQNPPYPTIIKRKPPVFDPAFDTPGSLVKPGESTTYRLYAKETGTFLLSSGADTTVHQLNAGLFGAVNVQPKGAEYYRSQTTYKQMQAATQTSEYYAANQMRLYEYDPYAPGYKLRPGYSYKREVKDPTGRYTRRLKNRTMTDPKFRTKSYDFVYLEDDSKRVYTLLGQPLIDYHSVFEEKDQCQGQEVNKPVLSMIQPCKGKQYRFVGPGKIEKGPNAGWYPLQKSNYEMQLQQLASGFIPPDLRALFNENKTLWDPELPTLSQKAAISKAADKNPLTWVITDTGGDSYLVQARPNPDKKAKSAGWLGIFRCKLQLVYSDLTAIITGPNAGTFPDSQDSPDFYTNPASPDRRQPYREFTIIYHQGGNLVQGFQAWSNNNLFRMINGGLDQFGINYGVAAIGPEILANRLGVGPMGNDYGKTATVSPTPSTVNDAVELKYEEFFLSSWCVGDPSMVVDVPANSPNQYVSNPTQGNEIQRDIADINANPVRYDEFKPLDNQRPTKAFYPDDPSNVYHGYMRDHTKMRVLHAGPGPAHVHHLHAHQWLHSPNSPDAHYLDSQLIIPGTGYTLEIAYNGAGNRNQTVGDSIFHCHFYPHFAKGMWSLWRVHDTFEVGTVLDENGVCETDFPNRALPDGEIPSGSPTPALIPVPTLGMAPMPARVRVTDLAPYYNPGVGMGRRIEVLEDEDEYGKKTLRNPGYPFFIPGVGGHRPPHPPMDTAWLEKEGDRQYWTPKEIQDQLKLNPKTSSIRPNSLKLLNGGLPRHLVLGGNILSSYNTRWDFTKDFIVPKRDADGNVIKNKEGEVEHLGALYAFELPEDGTPVEKAAMDANAIRTHASFLPENGKPGSFTLNGLPATHGAPYADPGVTDDGNSTGHPRRYQAAVIQTDVVLNKKGWHYPQQRFITLWEDVQSTIENTRPPQPFFIRTATGDSTEFWHTNLVPNYYELDDFQVRTPTDVIGQHIHLVKFDVTASDGAANGFNYEDGTFGPEEVQDRIHAITKVGGLYVFEESTGFINVNQKRQVAVWKNKYAYPPRKRPDGTMVGDPDNGLFGPPPPGQMSWDGAMTTIQRWDIDPLLNWQGKDRTLRTVFTHDHFGPSTHQQVGLYAGVLVEPEGSHWYLPDGAPMYTREDGGPTSWQAIITTADATDSYREYALEFQDMQLAYTAESTVPPGGSNELFKPELSNDAVKLMAANGVIYNGSEKWAPALFFYGQASEHEYKGDNGVASFIGNFAPLGANGVNVGDKFPVPQPFVDSFKQYGIQIANGAELIVIAAGTPTGVGAQWLLKQPPQTDDAGPVNGGDYYILRATNPQESPDAPGEFVPMSVSVYTPTIAPGYSDPEFAVNPNWGSNRTYTFTAQGTGAEVIVYAGNIGTPLGQPQQRDSHNQWTGNPDQFGNGAPYPSLVSTRANGTYSINYRNEPVPLRVAKGMGNQTDLAYVFKSIERGDAQLNKQPPPFQLAPNGKPVVQNGEFVPNTVPGGSNNKAAFPPYLIPGMGGEVQGKAYPGSLVQPATGGPGIHDPYTPLLRGYAGDKIQIRTLVGAHLQPHAFTIHGVKWSFEPSYKNSGWRNVQGMGISEHFEMIFDLPSYQPTQTTDYFYSPSTGAVGLSNGLWGIMRSYPITKAVDYLKPLENNPIQPKPGPAIDFAAEFDKANCNNKPTREFVIDVVKQSIEYNKRAGAAYTGDGFVFVLKSLAVNGGKPAPVKQPQGEPLILRAAAGEWIKVTLNGLDDGSGLPSNIAFPYGNSVPFNGLNDAEDNQPVGLAVSSRVGLHPQLVAFQAGTHNGINVGMNPENTAEPKGSKCYYWYAGEVTRGQDGKPVRTPIEFGATNLVGCDLMLQTAFGMVGALVIEPKGSTWQVDAHSRAFATVTKKDGCKFKECVLVMQNMAAGTPSPVTALPGFPPLPKDLTTLLTPGREAAPQQTLTRRHKGFGAVNYRTEVFAARSEAQHADIGFAQVFANSKPVPTTPGSNTMMPAGDPLTPIFGQSDRTPDFKVEAGTPVRFRVVLPSTTAANSVAQPLVIDIHGHGWQEEPYIKGATEIGDNPMSQFIGAQKLTVTQKYDFVIDSAGGAFKVPGDYLYQAFNREQRVGIWGVFRVSPAP